MAGKSSIKQMNHSDSDDNDEFFLPPSSTLSFHHAHLQRSEVNNSVTTFRSFSSDMEDDCLHRIRQDEHNVPSDPGGIDGKPPLTRQESNMSSENEVMSSKARLMRQGSIVDGLLHEIYDHWHGSRQDSFDSDTLTECSSTSEFMWCGRHDFGMYSMDGGYQSSVERRQTGCYTRSFLQAQDVSQLSRVLSSIQRLTTVMSARLVRQLKRRDRRLAKRNRNYDVVTAILQAASLKRQIDTRMRFSIAPPQGQPSAFDQWKDAMRAVGRLPMGIPTEFRKKVWLSLADHYLVQLRINWDKTVRFVFNERSNPDDDKLGMQIVKDLHRTGCSNFSGDDNVEDRAILKRVLLAYARWNKRVGYCQGFNVIAALLLNVMDRKEDDALKVMIYLIDSVLPESYFANNLRALSVDMAVFRDLLALTYPRLSKHLDRLQLQAQDVRTGACYEPPLTNVFTMQWFLTLFATCLPVTVVLRVWDSVLLEGSEILLRTALTIWGKLSKRILGVSSADEFYSVMGELSTSIMEGSIMDGDSIIKSIYSLGNFPFPHLNELREKYTYNIRPLTPSTSSGVRKVGGRSLIKAMLYSDDDDMDDDDVTAMACMPGEMSSSSSDISVLGPGVYGSGLDPSGGGGSGRGGGDMQMERMSTDINSLKLQYQRLKERQQQAHIIIAAASQKKAQLVSSSSSSSSSKKPLSSSSSSSRPRGVTPSLPSSSILLPSIESPTAMNHLFVGKHKPPSASAKNRLVTQGPRISQHAPLQHNTSSILSKQLQAVANAQAVSKSQRMRSSRSNNKQGDLTQRVTDTRTPSVPNGADSRTPSPPSDSDTNIPSTQQSTNSEAILTPKSPSTETASRLPDEAIDSSPVVKDSTVSNTDKKVHDKFGASDKGGHQYTQSMDNKSSCHLTSDLNNLSEAKEHPTIPAVTLDNVSDSGSCNTVVSTDVAESNTSLGSISGTTDVAVPDSLGAPKDADNDSISDKSVQTSFESWDHFDNVTDQEDCCISISRGSTPLPAIPCQAPETGKTPGDNDDTLLDACVSTTHSPNNTVPYTQDRDNTCIDNAPNDGCNRNSQSQRDNPPQSILHLPSTDPHTNTILPQDNPRVLLSTDPPPTTTQLQLLPGENPTEDSGIDSSSTASPSTTPKRGPKNSLRSDSVDDGIEIHASQDINPQCDDMGKKDTVLFVTTTRTTTTSLPNRVQISQTDDSCRAGDIPTLTISSNSERGLCADIDSTTNDHDKDVTNTCLTSEKGSGESTGDETELDGQGQREISGNESLNTTETSFQDKCIRINIDPSHKTSQSVSPYSNTSHQSKDPPSPSTPTLSTITTTTSPQRKFFRRSVSCTVSSPGLIETVPVPENLTGSEAAPTTPTHKHTKHQKQHTTQTSPSTHDASPSDSLIKNTSQSSISKNVNPAHPTPSIKSGDVLPAYSRRLSIPASCHMTNDASTKKPFNPFPVKLFNANRAKTGLKLGLYSATTLEQLKGLKPRTTST